MPNHVINILNIDGDKDKVAKMLSEIQNDEYGIGSIDFEKIIPMPESTLRTRLNLLISSPPLVLLRELAEVPYSAEAFFI